MPNYVMNNVTIKGTKEQIEKAKAVCCGMDFNKMIPMPATLNVSAGSITNQALRAYAFSLIGTNPNVWTDEDLLTAERIAHYHGKNSLTDAINDNAKCLSEYNVNGEIDDAHPYGHESIDISYLWTEEDYRKKEPRNRADYIALGRVIYGNVQKYECTDWYEWTRRIWGTKWNAIDTEVTEKENEITYRFTTAWSCPDGIMEYMAESLQDMEIHWDFADEDLGYNCEKLIKEVDSIDYLVLDSDNLSIACEIWGYDEEEILAERAEFDED